MVNVVFIHGFNIVYLHQGVSYIASSGLLTFNLKLITSGTFFQQGNPKILSVEHSNSEGTRNILLSKRDVASMVGKFEWKYIFTYGFIDYVVSYRMTVSFLVLLIYNYTLLTLSSCR